MPNQSGQQRTLMINYKIYLLCGVNGLALRDIY